MFCTKCGKEIPDGVKFCPECGISQIDNLFFKKEKIGNKNSKEENLQILMYSIPGLLFLFATIVGAYIANSIPPEPIGTINGETVYSTNEACSSLTYGCIEFALYGLCVAITNIFFAFAFVKKPETSQTVFYTILSGCLLLGFGALFLGSSISFQFQTIGICSSLLIIVIVLFALDNNKSKIEAAGEAWLMLTVLGAIVAIILYLMIF